ncbi:MAG TPA: hypothetical protein VFW11_24105 [Cyclobacteriaceae bacterium]|nr:hypothetical protein [Cyclobacteriaceae bacterium]
MIKGIFENEFLTCELDDALPVLRHHWKKSPSGEEFRSNLLLVLKEYQALSQDYKSLAWLADTVELGELDEETETWLVKEWEHLLFGEGGVKIHAVILGANFFADYPMEKFKHDAEQKFKDYDVHLGVFSNLEEAYAWIRKKQLRLAEGKLPS